MHMRIYVYKLTHKCII